MWSCNHCLEFIRRKFKFKKFKFKVKKTNSLKMISFKFTISPQRNKQTVMPCKIYQMSLTSFCQSNVVIILQILVLQHVSNNALVISMPKTIKLNSLFRIPNCFPVFLIQIIEFKMPPQVTRYFFLIIIKQIYLVFSILI